MLEMASINFIRPCRFELRGPASSIISPLVGGVITRVEGRAAGLMH